MDRDEIIGVLCKCSPCTIQELASMVADIPLIELRRILSDLHRKGIVSKKPDYSRGKMVFAIDEKYCRP